ncbi:unnamed protein product, partial [Nesidiocoris tenuis]
FSTSRRRRWQRHSVLAATSADRAVTHITHSRILSLHRSDRAEFMIITSWTRSVQRLCPSVRPWDVAVYRTTGCWLTKNFLGGFNTYNPSYTRWTRVPASKGNVKSEGRRAELVCPSCGPLMRYSNEILKESQSQWSTARIVRSYCFYYYGESVSRVNNNLQRKHLQRFLSYNNSADSSKRKIYIFMLQTDDRKFVFTNATECLRTWRTFFNWLIKALVSAKNVIPLRDRTCFRLKTDDPPSKPSSPWKRQLPRELCFKWKALPLKSDVMAPNWMEPTGSLSVPNQGPLQRSIECYRGRRRARKRPWEAYRIENSEPAAPASPGAVPPDRYGRLTTGIAGEREVEINQKTIHPMYPPSQPPSGKDEGRSRTTQVVTNHFQGRSCHCSGA